jgi:hypothetical protein
MKYTITAVFTWVVLNYLISAIAPYEAKQDMAAAVPIFNAVLAGVFTYLLHLWLE